MLEYFREDNTTMKTIIRTAIVAAFMFVVSVPFVAAQGDFNKGEFFGGYTFQKNSNDKLDILEEDVKNANGFSFSGTYNFTRLAGVKGEISWTKASDSPYALTQTSFMGGLQLKNNDKEGSMIRPFAHVMAGFNKGKLLIGGSSMLASSVDAPAGGPISISWETTKFTMAIGGGIDIKASDRISVRAIQVDYKPTFVGNIDGIGEFGTLNSIRMSFGIVIH